MTLYSSDSARPDRSVLCEHFISEVMEACADLRLSAHEIKEVASAVASFCADHLSGACFPTRYLGLILARALWCLGEKEAALQYAEKQHLEVRRFEHMVGMRGAWIFSPAVWTLYERRLLKLNEWLVENSGMMWTIDLGRLSPENSAYGTLTLLPALRLILERMAEVWDETQGAGALALKGFEREKDETAGCRLRVEYDDEVYAFCRHTLEKIKARRNWSKVPRIVLLDHSRRPAPRKSGQTRKPRPAVSTLCRCRT